MYVCVCAAVTDRQLRAAVAAGNDSMAKLTMSLGVGSGCGCCLPLAREMLAESACNRQCADCKRERLAEAA